MNVIHSNLTILGYSANQRMTKGIFLNIPSTGHINPSLALITELVNRGEEILYVLTDTYETKVKATGARFLAYPEITALHQLNELAADGNIPHNAHMLVKIGEQLLPFLFDLIEREQPDYLIYDSLCGWGLMAAQKFPDLPTIVTTSTFVINSKNPPPLSLIDIVRTLGQLLQEILPYWQTHQRIQKHFGIKSIGLLEAVMTPAPLNLVYTSKEFQPKGQSFDNSFRFVGPCIIERTEPIEFAYEFLENRPLVYISLGTINNTNVDFFKDCIRAFKDFPAYFIMSIGKQQSLDALGNIPENFLVKNFVPQLEILKHSDVFITHGGLNSVHEGLLESVALLVIPQQVEQAVVARQVTKFGAGQSLSKNTTIEQMQKSVSELLSDKSYRQKAEILGKSLKHAGGAKKAVDEILQYVSKKRHN